MQGFIEISRDVWYEEATGHPYRYRTAKKVLQKVTTKSDNGYYRIRVNGKQIRFHRLVYEFFKGAIQEGTEVDHINNIKTDNRIDNLKAVTHSENMKKYKPVKIAKTGFTGVSKKHNKWRSALRTNGKIKYLGYFDTPEKAYIAYLKAKIDLHGLSSIASLKNICLLNGID